jgi:RNA polymerase sigma-70 factor, ECF subfamily
LKAEAAAYMTGPTVTEVNHFVAFTEHDLHGGDTRHNGDRPPLDLTQQTALTASWTTERRIMSADADAEKSRRFREAALPHLDDVFSYARYLTRSTADAEDAVQECYMRALHHFDSYRGPAVKPWLLAILKNVCNAEFARRSKQPAPAESETDWQEDERPMWQEPQASPEAVLLRRHDDERIRRLVAALPEPFREAIVLREVNDLSYGEIADVAGVPVGTVMSRLARARSMLRAAWNLEEGTPR